MAVGGARKKTIGLVLETLKENVSVSEDTTYFGDMEFESV